MIDPSPVGPVDAALRRHLRANIPQIFLMNAAWMFLVLLAAALPLIATYRNMGSSSAD